mmetsp:Transcript_26541/g.71112  ORF Transcript_26541/g.71112 Transcript_26541/m.71112 type:complete len:191 (-) Transcript_26541:91-663(-)
MEKHEQCRLKGRAAGIALYEKLVPGFKAPSPDQFEPAPACNDVLVAAALVTKPEDLPLDRKAPDPRSESYPHDKQGAAAAEVEVQKWEAQAAVFGSPSVAQAAIAMAPSVSITSPPICTNININGKSASATIAAIAGSGEVVAEVMADAAITEVERLEAALAAAKEEVEAARGGVQEAEALADALAQFQL